MILPISGALLGCAVGDAIGLPYEGLTKQRGVRLLGAPDCHRFVFGRGMLSDDTEHTCMVAQALCEAPNDPDLFARKFSARLRWWLAGLPAGIGLATLKATLKLWLGFSPSRSGVYSAGNGPAMRCPILGAVIDDLEMLRRFVKASTRITHTDPKAYYGAYAVALAAWCAKRGLHSPPEFFGQFRSTCAESTSDEFTALMAKVESSLATGESTATFAEQLGCRRGVTGYIYRTVPVALHCWLSHPRDYRLAVRSMVECGGDTDTTAAIVGAIVGSGVGRDGIPREWIDRIWEWPHSVAWMEQLAEAVSTAVQSGTPVKPPQTFFGARLARNGIFTGIVAKHIARRLLPPY